MTFQTPLNRVLRLGSAKHGLGDWWWQRLTAIALVPLMLWLVIDLVSHLGDSHAAIVAWMQSPVVAALWIMSVTALVYHGQLGLQVIIEDYVHTESLKLASLIVLKFIAVLLALTAVVSILRIAMGGGQ